MPSLKDLSHSLQEKANTLCDLYREQYHSSTDLVLFFRWHCLGGPIVHTHGMACQAMLLFQFGIQQEYGCHKNMHQHPTKPQLYAKICNIFSRVKKSETKHTVVKIHRWHKYCYITPDWSSLRKKSITAVPHHLCLQFMFSLSHSPVAKTIHSYFCCYQHRTNTNTLTHTQKR